MAPSTALLAWAALSAVAAAQPLVLNGDCSVTDPLRHFWESTGYTPAEMALRSDMVEKKRRGWERCRTAALGRSACTTCLISS